MTDRKISELTNITGANVDDANDEIAIVDASANETKAITRAELFSGVSSVDINGGTIDGTVIGGSTPAAISGTTGSFSGDLTVDTDTLFVDASTNRVGIGTSSPATTLDVSGVAAAEILRTGSRPAISVPDNGGTNRTPPLMISGNAFATTIPSVAFYNTTASAGTFNFLRSNTTTVGDHALVSNGNVIGTLQWAASDGFNFRRASQIEGQVDGTPAENDMPGRLVFLTTPSGSTAPTERLRINSSGNVGIGTSSPSATLDVNGSLSKSSGSFKIDHPVKPDTHYLVHSFIEGPQADNLYRGKVVLVDGSATVNLDEAGRMTEGTFVALNGNVQCFTTNEDGWTQVRGKVSGNSLTIEAQDPACTDEVSWLVIGERHDQHMIETEWTDENGRVITEPAKENDND